MQEVILLYFFVRPNVISDTSNEQNIEINNKGICYWLYVMSKVKHIGE